MPGDRYDVAVSTSAEDLHEIAAQRLRRAGQRYTPTRRSIVAALVDADAPLTLPDILSAQPRLAQSSAYRNLAELVAVGVVDRVNATDTHDHFELAELLTDHHHHHLVCRACGLVTDFTLPEKLERELDKALARVAGADGFDIDHHRLDLIGRCSTCATG